jgi:ankyrin repeat protein
MEQGDRLGLTPWHYLMRGPYVNVLNHVFNYYIQRKIKLNFSSLKSHSQETLAHLSARFGQTNQLALVLAHMSRDSINQKTIDGFTAISYALLGDHLDCFRLLIDAGCRTDQTTRSPDSRRTAHKGDNLLHQIGKKTDLTEALEKIFKEISKKHPKLLIEKNSSEKTVLEELSQKGHLSLIPITIFSMPNNETSREAIARALQLTQTQLSNKTFITGLQTKAGSDISHRIVSIHRILAYSNIQTYLGKDLTWTYRSRSIVDDQTVQSLIAQAEEAQTPSLQNHAS